ncbi:hypothetical protein CFC21_098877 [Triticum aestivum]|uniref:Uncharacterized protein n=3 Tax=Triticum TaxID=4564 RepID=A0A9R0ZHP1_TRITD|nr:hypothetical protein CFC21_098877 [Triticum aestivum]VAI78107.1 unnamed protein product [Triticum turgidum subsp. durum]
MMRLSGLELHLARRSTSVMRSTDGTSSRFAAISSPAAGTEVACPAAGAEASEIRKVEPVGGWQQAMRLGGGAAGLVRAGERRREKRGRGGGWNLLDT